MNIVVHLRNCLSCALSRFGLNPFEFAARPGDRGLRTAAGVGDLISRLLCRQANKFFRIVQCGTQIAGKAVARMGLSVGAAEYRKFVHRCLLALIDTRTAGIQVELWRLAPNAD